MKWNLIIVSACLGALLLGCGGGSSPSKAPAPVTADKPVLTGVALQAAVERVRASNNLPGLTVVMVDKGSIETVTVGTRRADGGAAIAPTDQFQLGSLTKASSAMLIARLVEQRKMRWDSTLAELLPDWSAGMHPSLRAVTIEQVLQMRAGLKRDIDEADAVALRSEGTGNAGHDRALLARRLLGQVPAFTPDTKYSYSNLGYMLAGLIAETAGGGSYESLMEKEVFAPLQMKASFGIPEYAGLDALSGHELDGNAWSAAQYGPERRKALAINVAAGGLMVSMADYGKFLKAHLDGLKGKSAYLTADTFRRLHAPVDEYGLGWMVQNEPGLGTISFHDGTILTYYAITAVIPGSDRALAVVCNCWSPAAQEAVGTLFLQLAAGQGK